MIDYDATMKQLYEENERLARELAEMTRQKNECVDKMILERKIIVEMTRQRDEFYRDAVAESKQKIEYRTEVERLRGLIAEAKRKISEIAFNCPSCGRHDFGLVSGPTAEVGRLQGLFLKTEKLIQAIETGYSFDVNELRKITTEAAKGGG